MKEYVCKNYTFRPTRAMHSDGIRPLYEIDGLKPATCPPYLTSIRACINYIMQHRQKLSPDKLIAARKACGYTQEQLAELLFISRPTISYWERGLFCPSGEMLSMLADALRCSPEYLTEQE